MTRQPFTPIVLLCAALSGACSSERPGPVAPVAPVLTSLEFTPASMDLEQGLTGLLKVTLSSQSGAPIYDPSVKVTWASSAPSVATVLRGYATAGTALRGYVTALAPGTVQISVTATLGRSSKTAVMTTRVLPTTIHDSVVLTFGELGWQPFFVHVVAGGLVTWQSDPKSLFGVPNTTVWLLDPATYKVVDSLDLRSGSASRRFATSGTIRYCSRGCWDEPEYGVIYVH